MCSQVSFSACVKVYVGCLSVRRKADALYSLHAPPLLLPPTFYLLPR